MPLPQAQSGQEAAALNRKVLVVDDNRSNSYMLEVLLASQGFEVVTARNGLEALQALHREGFDGIISDIMMPGMDGFQLIRECKRDPRLRLIPFIFYTATYTDKKDQELGMSLGADRYIIKPEEPEVILGYVMESFRGPKEPAEGIDAAKIDDDNTFLREYSERVVAKLENKIRVLGESEERFRALFETMAQGVIYFGPDGRVIEANLAAERILGLSAEEMRGRTMGDPRWKTIHEDGSDYPADEQPATMALRTGKEAQGVMGILSPRDRNYRWLIIDAVPRFRPAEDRPFQVFVTFEDITERKKAEERIGLANRKLNLMNDVTYQDIQNKVTALRWYVDYSAQAKNKEERASIYEKESALLDAIHHLIRNTKSFQRMGMDRKVWVPLEQEIRTQASMISTGKGFSIMTDLDGLEIFSDPLIGKVFYHLIDNALKHGKKATRISFSYREANGGVTIFCEDDGVGIPAREKARIFDRVVAGEGKFDLFFVHEFLDISGMSIVETGTENEGARFEITVPRGSYRLASEAKE